MSVWDHLQHFKRTGPDHWGDPDMMNPALLLLLDQLRDIYGKPFIVFEGFAISGHVTKSKHYLGCAVDFYIKDAERTFFEQVGKLMAALAETRLVMLGWQNSKCCAVAGNQITGLGIYPDNHIPSFHLDIRNDAARWGRLDSKYIPFKDALEVARKMK